MHLSLNFALLRRERYDCCLALSIELEGYIISVSMFEFSGKSLKVFAWFPAKLTEIWIETQRADCIQETLVVMS